MPCDCWPIPAAVPPIALTARLPRHHPGGLFDASDVTAHGRAVPNDNDNARPSQVRRDILVRADPLEQLAVTLEIVAAADGCSLTAATRLFDGIFDGYFGGGDPGVFLTWA